jgi:glycosyltransferase involved in cell wall biosynthesis
MPRVSVCIPAYNHARFVRESLESVLAQSFQDFEIVVTDDGSSDGTADAIAAIHDTRISLKRFPANRGACAALNDAVRRSGGEYVAVLNSDDAFLPHKLETQVEFLDVHPEIGAVFGFPAFVDEAGRPVESTFNGRIFDQPNRTQAEWLRHFFFLGNCLCHPTVLIRRACYDRIGLYDERLAQLPDFDMWVRLIAHYPIHILSDTMLLYRELGSRGNASAPRPESVMRTFWERRKIAEHFRAVAQRLFEEAFAQEIRGLGLDASLPRAYVLGRIAVASRQWNLVLPGLDWLHEALAPQGEGAGEAFPEFAHIDLIRATGANDVYHGVYALQAEQSLRGQQERIAELERVLDERGRKGAGLGSWLAGIGNRR